MNRLEHVREILEGYAILPESKVRRQLDSELMKSIALTGYPLCQWFSHDTAGWCLELTTDLVKEVQVGTVVWARPTGGYPSETVHVLEREVQPGVWSFLSKTQRDAEWIRIWLEMHPEPEAVNVVTTVAAVTPAPTKRKVAKKPVRRACAKPVARLPKPRNHNRHVSESALYGGTTKVREDYPEAGIYAAVVEDVCDVGWRKNPWGGGKYCVQIVFLLAHKDGEGFYRMRANYDVKDGLHKVLETIMQKPVEESKFEFPELIGRSVSVVVTKRTNKDGLEYSSVTALLKTQQELIVPRPEIGVAA